MIQKFAFLLFCCLPIFANSQTTGDIIGQVTVTGEDVPPDWAEVVLLKDSMQVTLVACDFNGNYNFSKVPVGAYDLTVLAVGFDIKTIQNIRVSSSTIKLDIEISRSLDATTPEIEVEAYKEPIICFECPPSIKKIDEKTILTDPDQDIEGLKARKAGVIQRDAGEKAQGPGRLNGDIVLVDNIPTPSEAVNPMDIKEMTILTSGFPARYGDVTGFLTSIITKGPSSRFSGGVQLESSQYLDNFGENRVNLFASGPLLSKPIFNEQGMAIKDEFDRQRRKTILGYRFSGTYHTTLDDRPSALGTFRLKQPILDEILLNPLVANPGGSGYVSAADYLTTDDLERTNVRSNARSSFAQYAAKLELKPNDDYFFALTSQGEFNWGNSASINNQLFNYKFNPTSRDNTWRIGGLFRHTVSSTIPGNGEEEKTGLQPVFQNLSYEIQGDYSESNFFTEDPRYKDRFWEYGYVGKFYESRRPVIGFVDSIAIMNTNGEVIGWESKLGHQAYYNSFDAYEANWDINPGLAAYNQHLAAPDPFNPEAPTTLNEMEVINGLVTGGRGSVYGLFNAPHLNGSNYGKSQTQQIRGLVNANFELVTNQKSGNPIRHKIEIGGVFEQRIERSYSINPFSLWNLAYQSANAHISNATDPSRPTGERFFDPLTERYYDVYEALIREDEFGNQVEMSAFGSNLREELGLNYRDWVAVHEINPEQMQLDWFEPSTLITGRQRVLNYYGYDYLGNPLGANISFNDFFNATDAAGRKTRPIAPNKPIYVAGYLEDKFIYKDFICRFGVRFDSYDANTSVLKDPYSVAGYETAAEFESSNSRYEQGQTTEYLRPSNIGDDYAVYVNGNNRDAIVVGYRNQEQWYNAQGLPVNTPSELGTSIMPALKGFGTSVIDPQGDNYNPDDAFRDYKPNVIVSPRIAISFPISDKASFSATYDVLAKRPTAGAFASPYDYFNFREIVAGGGYINNPNLLPERTINYEVGYQQAFSEFSAVKLSMIYREDRNMIQLRQYIQAYPITYTSFGNDDFATTKAFKLEYEMRAHKNSNLTFNAHYMLQFAEGTGSNPTSSAGVAARELKNIFALDFDQRHNFFASANYAFGKGKDYKGPRIKNIPVLENTSITMNANLGSGRPYTRKEIPGGIGTSFSDRITDGSINGARMPWNFRLSLRIDKNFVIGAKGKNPVLVNVYIRIQNLLNTQNVLRVYSVTGSPTDDGFLEMQGSPGIGFAASQPESYEMLYGLREANPYNISRPRRIFVGARVSF